MRLIFQRDVDGASGDVYFMRLAGLSTETKPTENVATGSIFIEVDTDKKYRYDEDSTSWTEEPATIDPEAISEAVEDWLDDHPEATTTVVDGAITYAKLDSSLKGSVDDVSDLKNEIDSLEGGTTGQVLRKKSNTDLDVEWADNPNAEEIASAVDDWLDDHPEATTTVQDRSLTENKIVVGTLGYVTPEMFGAVGDGVTDDAEAIQDAIDYCILNHKKLVFHTRTYGVIPYQQDKSVVLYNNEYYALLIKGSVEIDLNGATIQLLTNTISGFCVVSIRDTENVKFKNGTIIGDRDTFTVSGDNSQLLNIFDSKYVLIDNILMKDSKGDCFGHYGVQINQPYTTHPFSDFYMGNVIQNCVMKHSARHGMTFSKGRGVTFFNCRIEDVDPTGVLSWSGCAVDMEPYYGSGSVFDVRFDSCSMTDNIKGPYIQCADSVRFTNCYIQSIGFRSSNNCMVTDCVVLNGASSDSSSVIFDGNNMFDKSISIRNTQDTYTSTGEMPEIIVRNNKCGQIHFNSPLYNYKNKKLIIENNTIESTTANILIIGKPGEDTITGEIIVSNNTIIAKSSLSGTASGYILSLAKDIKNITYDNNKFIYDYVTVGQTAYVIDAEGVTNYRFINNIIQRKAEQNETYTSVIRNVFRLKDVGTALISGNTINPDNTVFGTLSIALIKAETSSGGTNVKLLLMDNYAYGVTSITDTEGAINLLVDNNNILNNVAPFSSASGVNF